MKKRVIYIAGTILEIAFIVGVFVLNWLPRAKLGFNRWAVHLNQTWERQLPIDALKVAVLVVLAAAVVALVVRLVRASRRSMLSIASCAAAIVLLGASIWFVCAFSSAANHSYYLIASCLELACLIQVIKAFAIGRST